MSRPLIHSDPAYQFLVYRLHDKGKGDIAADNTEAAKQEGQRDHVPEDQLRTERASRTL